MQFWSKAKEPVGNGEGSGRRSNGEVTVLLLNRRDGIAPATHTYALDDRRMSAVGGIIPLLEKDEAIRLEFICLPVHLPGKHWPTVAMETEDDPFSPCQSSEEPAWLYLDSSWGMMARACDTTPKLTICGVLARNGGRSTAWIDPWDRECFITSASDEWSGFPVACLACSRHSVLQIRQRGVHATWRLRCRSIVHISLGYMTDPLEWFKWIVLMMTLPSNPPSGSSTATM